MTPGTRVLGRTDLSRPDDLQVERSRERRRVGSRPERPARGVRVRDIERESGDAHQGDQHQREQGQDLSPLGTTDEPHGAFGSNL